MVFVCYVLMKEASLHINFICFNRNFDHPIITVVTFVPRKQSKKLRFFLKMQSFCWKNLQYVSAVRFVLALGFSKNSRPFRKIDTFAVLLKN